MVGSQLKGMIMKALHYLSVLSCLAVISLSVPSLTLASQCWCTCTSGYRDCANLDARSCSAKDASLTYCSCSWSAAGYCPSNASAKYDRIKGIIPVNDQPETKALEPDALKDVKVSN